MSSPEISAHTRSWAPVSLNGSARSRQAQITAANVKQLKVAWTYHTGEISDGSTLPVRRNSQTKMAAHNAIPITPMP